MVILIIGIVILGLLTGLIAWYQHHRLITKLKNGEIAELPVETAPATETEEECCGQYATCEKDSLLAAVSKEIVYYDDEELDAFRHIESNQYGEDIVEEFRHVFYTLQETDVAGWVRSLHLREIELPDQIKDEVLLIIGERRIH